MSDPLTFGSLFAGIGGFDLGFERAGMVCKWQVEIDDYATLVLEKHWPDVRRWRDITTFPPDASGTNAKQRQVIDNEQEGADGSAQKRTGLCCEPGGCGGEWKVDVICGGFPCQDISYAGRGAGLEGERSGLFFEAIRVIRELGPRIVVLENVAALLTRGLDVVLGTLASIGFDAEWHCIPAAAVGAPHIRDRVFVVGYATGTGSLSSTHAGVHSSEEGTGPRNAESKRRGEAFKVSYANSQGLERQTRQDGTTEKRQSIRHIAECNWWATEPDVGRVANGVPKRVDRLRGLGNAVVPQVAEWIGRQIVESDQ